MIYCAIQLFCAMAYFIGSAIAFKRHDNFEGVLFLIIGYAMLYCLMISLHVFQDDENEED